VTTTPSKLTRGRRIVAARYLRTLATIETLMAIGNESEAQRLLAGIDHVEARELANELDAENQRPAQVIPIGNPTVLDVWRETYPQLLHADDNWSRKVGG
jgi:phosphohistidine phosphatase SixA